MRHRAYRWLAVISPAVALVAWELAARTGILRPAFFPPPSAIGQEARALLAAGEIQRHTAVTLVRLGWVFLLATVPGFALGLAMGISREVRQALDPVLAVVYPIPAVLFLPVFAIALGPGDAAVVATSSITSFVIVAVSTMAAVRGLDRVLIEAAHVFGARGWRFFTRVLLPGALPVAFGGVRVALGMAVILLIATEMNGAQSGLGYYLWFKWSLLEVRPMYVALLITALIGLAATYGLDAAGRALMPWRDGAGPGARGVGL